MASRENLQGELLDHAHPDPALTQSAQAWPPEVITMHAREIRKGVEIFTTTLKKAMNA